MASRSVASRIGISARARIIRPLHTAMTAPPGGKRRGHAACPRRQGVWGAIPCRRASSAKVGTGFAIGRRAGCLPGAEAAATIRAGAKAGRAVVHRAAAAIGAAVPAGAAAARDQDHFGRCALCDGGCQRHGLGRRHADQAKADGESRSSKQFHWLFLFLACAATRRLQTLSQTTATKVHQWRRQ